MSELMLSVCVVVYNHEKYIVECLEHILAQKVDFEMEILIGNDCSKDRSSEIIKEKFGEKVTLIDRPQNLGLCKNMYDLFQRAGGKYVYMFSGDDYIKDECTFQKQVDFLETHSDYFSVSARNLNYHQGKGTFDEVNIECGDYTIMDFFMDGKIPCIYGTMRNIFSKDKANNSFLQGGAKNNEEMKMWIYTLDQGKKYILEDYMTVYRFRSESGESNYCSNMTYLDLFNDYYQDLIMLEPIYGKKYNLKPYELIIMNKYCIIMSGSLKELISFFKVLRLKDAIYLIWFKLYLKAHNYQVPAKWHCEDYIIR